MTTSAQPVGMQPPVILRNNTQLALSKMTFGKKSKKHVGKPFFAPEINGENLEQATVWLGKDEAAELINRALRITFQNIFLDNVREDGSFNSENYLLDCQEFDVGADTLTDIEEKLEMLQTEQFNVSNDPEFGSDSDRGAQLLAAIKETAGKIKPLRIKRDAIKEKYKEIAKKREETKKKNKTEGTEE